MGCGGSRTKLDGIDHPLTYELELLNNDEIDRYFTEMTTTLMKAESIRETYVDCYEKLCSLSGACVWKGNNFNKIYTSYFVNCELEAPGFYKQLTGTSYPPYFKHEVGLVKHKKLDECMSTFIKLTIGGDLEEVKMDKGDIYIKKAQLEKILEEESYSQAKLYIRPC
jgi:hypothetical protein